MPGTGPTLRAEWSILLAACSATPREQKVARLRSLLQQPVPWKSLITLAERHGALPLLYQALLGMEAEIPAEEMQKLKQNYHTNLHKMLLLSSELIRILEHLSTLGVEVMPYKGLALAETLYGDITLRQSGDIDLLIRPPDLPRIRRAVSELGYVPHVPLTEEQEQAYLKSGYECAFDGAAGRNLLEVEWGIQPRFYAVDFDMDGIFRRAMTVKVAERTMRTPCCADLLLVLSAHAAKHVWDRLVWLCDIARLMCLPTLDWSWIASEAGNLGIVRIVWVTMLAANRLLDVPIPAAAHASLPQDSSAADFTNEVLGHIVSDVEYNLESPSYFRFMMRLRERTSDRLRFLQRLVFTPGPGEWQAVQLPRPLFPLYRLVRLTRLAARLVRA
jgi:putative nucleotidyltransferase-like protein